MFNTLQPWHIFILIVVLIVLFGAKKLPVAARGIGRSLRIFRSEVRELSDDPDGSDDPSRFGGTAPAEPSPAPGPTHAQTSQHANGQWRDSVHHPSSPGS